ncbi:MAG: adenosylcobinamide amidohydrolase [Veillonella sp. oral taxon 780]|jgi:hypothetical protein|nr:adenosylcobinamide amidohydrolase [Veillonella sp. oral taxon 780]
MPNYNQYKVPTTLRSGGYVDIHSSAITVTYDMPYYAISTSPFNGGLHHVMAVRNQQLTFFVNNESELPGGSTSDYLAKECVQLDLPIHFCTALLTTASMNRHAYVCQSEDSIIIEVIATAGVEKTAHRAGDGYTYYEKDGAFHTGGTINLLVFTNCALTDGALTKSLLTITEAKTVALQSIGITSVLSNQPATGTSTDGVIMTIDPNGELLTDTGTFSQFGDTLAKAVRSAIEKALENTATLDL